MPRAAKKPESPDDDARLVDADDVHRIRDHVLADRALRRAAHLDRDARGLRELGEVGLDARDRVPVARDQHQHREIGAERRHAALADAAAAVRDDLREVVHEADAIVADGGDCDELFHAGKAGLAGECTGIGGR